MAAPALLIFTGSLIISQVLFGRALERLGLKAALTGGSGTVGNVVPNGAASGFGSAAAGAGS